MTVKEGSILRDRVHLKVLFHYLRKFHQTPHDKSEGVRAASSGVKTPTNLITPELFCERQ